MRSLKELILKLYDPILIECFADFQFDENNFYYALRWYQECGL